MLNKLITAYNIRRCNKRVHSTLKSPDFKWKNFNKTLVYSYSPNMNVVYADRLKLALTTRLLLFFFNAMTFIPQVWVKWKPFRAFHPDLMFREIVKIAVHVSVDSVVQCETSIYVLNNIQLIYITRRIPGYSSN